MILEHNWPKTAKTRDVAPLRADRAEGEGGGKRRQNQAEIGIN